MTLLVERISAELVTEWSGPDLDVGQMLIVTEMDTDDNQIACRVLSIGEDVAEVEIVQGRLIAIERHDNDWPLSGQPPGYFTEPRERGPVLL